VPAKPAGADGARTVAGPGDMRRRREATTGLGRLGFSLVRHKANLDSPVERSREAAKHRQQVPLVIGIFKLADHGGGSADELGELRPRESGFLPKLVDFAGDLRVGSLLFELLKPLGLPLEVSPMHDLDGIGRRFSLPGRLYRFPRTCGASPSPAVVDGYRPERPPQAYGKLER
jgi:hypothetical protein